MKHKANTASWAEDSARAWSPEAGESQWLKILDCSKIPESIHSQSLFTLGGFRVHSDEY